ncbi:hypothetical protein F4824DRAFT_501192 [Ustulina deusta]|nr:hypothetical protein F4824DRAFT_501192 [Ustulina deusta]
MSNVIAETSVLQFGFMALSTALRFIPLGITALVVDIVIPPLLKPVGPKPLLIVSWVLAIAVLWKEQLGDSNDYHRTEHRLS